MPIYEYEPDAGSCDSCRDRFEVFQSMHDPPLNCCPECGQPCHRVVSACAAHKGTGGLLSTKNLERHGFTQYKRAGGGCYEKTCGQGPDVIRR